MSTRPPAVTSCPSAQGGAGVEDPDVVLARRLLHALDHGPRPGRRGVAGRGQDHGHARLGSHRERGALELAHGGGHERLPQVAGHPRHEGLGLRVPEAHVELEHLRPVRREHQARVQAPAEVDAAAGELPQDGAVDEAGGLLRGLVVQGGNRRRGAHATGVGPGVPVTDALAVLRRRQGAAGCAVAQREQRHLLALEPLLDQDQPPGLPEGPAEDLADGGVGLGPRVAHEHALPGREAVRLDHRAVAEEVERVARRRLVRAGEGTRGGHAGRPHDLLGEGLRPLEPRRLAPGAEHAVPRSPKDVGHPGHERRLGADDHDARLQHARQVEQALGVIHRHGVARRQRGDPGVAGRAVQLVDVRAPDEPDRESMRTSVGADEESCPRQASLAGLRGRMRRTPGAARAYQRGSGRPQRRMATVSSQVAGMATGPSLTPANCRARSARSAERPSSPSGPTASNAFSVGP